MSPDAWEFAGIAAVQVAGVVAVWLKVAADARHTRADAAEIRRETQPNSGRTLRDAIDRIERDLHDLTARLDHHIDRK